MMAANGTGAVTLGTADRAALVASIKDTLRIAQSDEDELIAGFGEASLQLAEAFTGQVMIAREITEIVTAGPGWARLSTTPVSAITSVATAGAQAMMPLAAERYAVDIDASGDAWVRRTDGAQDAVAVSLSAGLAVDWPSLPMALRQGVTIMAAYFYDNRDAARAAPAAVTALWRPYRRMRLAERVPA
jgi:uncharacterized phiE125 gp8 family phage protein